MVTPFQYWVVKLLPKRNQFAIGRHIAGLQPDVADRRNPKGRQPAIRRGTWPLGDHGPFIMMARCSRNFPASVRGPTGPFPKAPAALMCGPVGGGIFPGDQPISQSNSGRGDERPRRPDGCPSRSKRRQDTLAYPSSDGTNVTTAGVLTFADFFGRFRRPTQLASANTVLRLGDWNRQLHGSRRQHPRPAACWSGASRPVSRGSMTLYRLRRLHQALDGRPPRKKGKQKGVDRVR